MNSRNASAITSALFEAFFVVLGVVLAYLANEWRQEHASKERIQGALQSIIRELESNRDAVEESCDYHQVLFETIGEKRASGEALAPGNFAKGFFAPAKVLNTAWTTASRTAILEKMDYGQVLELSEIYAKQESYDHQSKVSGQIIYEALYKGGMKGVLANADNHAFLLSSFIYRENELLVHLNDAIKQFKNTKPQ